MIGRFLIGLLIALFGLPGDRTEYDGYLREEDWL